MIISVNENNIAKYRALFAKAYQALDEKGKIREGCQNDDKCFLSLDDYFAHMSDLLELDRTYMMLPLDESAFAINANSRTISAPKITVLQNDQIAETVMFTIDRYFDYMDLNNATVYVQWTLPDGKEGATEIEMKDIEFEPGKIRFGWPLDSEVTSQVGTVKYSVRFWVRKTVKDENNTDVDKVVYSFNTLTSSFTVSPSLQVEINDGAEVNAPHRENIFINAIKNSMITNGSVAIPQEPSFNAPGVDLPKSSHLKENTLTLKALAVASDNGSIDYEWYYTPAVDISVADGEKTLTFQSGATYTYKDTIQKHIEEGVVKETTVPGFNRLGGTTEVVFEEFDYSKLTQLNAKDKYFVSDATATPYPYKSYDGGLVVPTDNTVLYRKFTTYTVPAGTIAVTGQYQVRATNTTKTGANKSNAIPSELCKLVSPVDVVISTDLKTRIYITPGSSSNTINIVTNVNNQSADAEKTYTWERATANNSTWVTLTGETNASIDLNSNGPGWYKVTPAVKLNREDKFAFSKVCKATYEPNVPVLSYDDEYELGVGGIPMFNTNDTADLKIKVDQDQLKTIGETFYKDYDMQLFSSELVYTWQVQEPDKEPVTITNAHVESNLVSGPINGPVLTIRSTDNKQRTFICSFVNRLDDKFSTAATLSFIVG